MAQPFRSGALVRAAVPLSVPAVKHDFVGHVNPRCRVCRRTPMEAQRHPNAPCERPRPLFEGLGNG